MLKAEPFKMVTSVEGIAQFELENGVQVLLFPDPSKPQLTVNMTVFVGSRHEGYGEAGMAHLLEHMLFKGTPDHPNIPKVLKDHGAKMNGTTSYDRTNYFETLPATEKNLEFAIRLEADRLMNSYVKKEDLDSEMTVVRNEFERGENSPQRVLRQRMLATAYEWHNYGKTTIGNRADIERVPIDNLKAFYKKHYQPDNVMVIVAGNFNPERALRHIVKYFGSIPKPERKLTQTYTEEPAQDGERRVLLRRVGEVPLASTMYHIPSGAHPDYEPLDVLAHLMTNSSSGRLYEALVKETKLASSVDSGAYGLHDPGIIYFSANVQSDKQPQAVLDVMDQVINEVAEKGVTAEEVERSKRYWLNYWEDAMTDSELIAKQLSEWASQGDWRLMFLYRDRLEKVTPEDVQRVAKKYLRVNNRTVGVFEPTDSPQRVSVPATPDLAKMIGDYKGRKALAMGEEFDVSPGNIEKRTSRSELPSGVKVALLPKKTRGETVNLQLTLRYGNEENLFGKSVACVVLPALMRRGTKDMNRQELQDSLDKLRTQFRASGSPGSATFTIQTRRESVAAVLGLLKKVLREPSLPLEELEIIRNRQISGLEQQLTDPQSLAITALNRATNPYKPGHPRYRASVKENIQNWRSLTVQDLKDVYNDYLNGQHGELVIVGDFDPKTVQPLISDLFADWKPASKKTAHIPHISKVKLTDKREQIETPDKENAVYFAGTVFPISDSHPDYPALMIGNYIFGSGGLSSRLGDRVRQKEGLSYGVGSQMVAQPLDDRAAMLIYAITNPQNMGKVETAIKEEITRLLKDGVTDAELAKAKTGFLDRQKLSRTKDGDLASILSGTLHAERDMSYYSDLEKKIGGLTTDKVNDTLRKYVDPKRLTLIVAGDFKGKAKE